MNEGNVDNEKHGRTEAFFENLNRLRRRERAARMLFDHEVETGVLKARHASDLCELRTWLEEHWRPDRVVILQKRMHRQTKGHEDSRVVKIESFDCKWAGQGELDRWELKCFIENRDQSFSETLLALIEKRGMTNAQCYRAAQVDRKLFSKIKNDALYVPAKPTALALVMALKLDIEEAEALLAKAGYALSRASTFDLIVRYFIENGMYDVLKANEMLYSLDQRLLGGRWK